MVIIAPKTSYETRGVGFFQEVPQLTNAYLEDVFLRSLVRRHLEGSPNLSEVESDLEKFGARAVKECMPKAYTLDQYHNPQLLEYDGFGNRVDWIITSSEWHFMHKVSAEEGLIALGYQTVFPQLEARIFQFAKLLIFGSRSGMYDCPLAMTDGAAVLSAFLLKNPPANGFTREGRLLIEETFRRTTSRNPDEFWTSGQWMTERGSGSDVSGGTRTIAKQQADGSYRIWGVKWFCSATTTDVVYTLAKIEEKDGTFKKGLSCFLMRIRNLGDKKLNNLQVIRLKKKMGTRQLPTCEMELCGSKAYLVSEPGRGISTIAKLMNVTRLHNAIAACSFIQRVYLLALDFAKKRKVFGSLLIENPLHMKTLASMSSCHRVNSCFTFEVVKLLACSEDPKHDKRELRVLLRLLTPLLKLFTAKFAVATASEGLETFGAYGYMEWSGLPSILRDSQVLPIWEGTTNVCSMDLLRVFKETKGEAFSIFEQNVQSRLERAKGFSALATSVSSVEDALDVFIKLLQKYPPANLVALARDLAMSMARVFAAACLIDHAACTKRSVDMEVARRFCHGEEQCSHMGSPTLVSKLLLNPQHHVVSDSDIVTSKL